jgi:hypothetical protein
MKPFIIVIGDSNSGKSTIISSLTGCNSHGYQNTVKDNQNGKEIYVFASSPQEDGSITSHILRITINQVVRDSNIIGLVIAVQPKKTRTRVSLKDIVQLAQRANSFDIYAFALKYSYQGNQINRTFVDNELQPFNITADYIDGRHFALINAMHIKQVTGIPR